MSDSNIRELAHQVDRDHVDAAARRQLTRSLLRVKHGIVAWWPGSQQPHPAACRVTLTYTTKNEDQEFVVNSGGWAVAVSDTRDMFEFSKRARQCTFLDLASSDWLQTRARRASIDLGTLTSMESTEAGLVSSTRCPSEDRLDRYRAAGHEEPLYDTEYFPSLHEGVNISQLVFFQNTRSFSWFPPGYQSWKSFGMHTNLAGNGGAVPQGCLFDMTGVTIQLFDNLMYPLQKDDVLSVCHKASLRITYGNQYILGQWPLDTLVMVDHSDQDDAEVVKVCMPSPPVFPLAWSLVFSEHVAMRVELNMPPEFPFSFFAKCILSGFYSKAQAG